MNFMHDDGDRWMCNKLLFYQNDAYVNIQWERELENAQCCIFERPKHWPARSPLVAMLAFCLHDNHIHLLIKETCEGGLSAFMRRFPNSLSQRYNKKYGGSGGIFQGPYQSRLIGSDADLRNVALYIMVKNVFERYPQGGLVVAGKDFESVYAWALSDPFSSFADYAGERASPIITKEILSEYFSTPHTFKREVREYMQWRHEREETLSGLLLE